MRIVRLSTENRNAIFDNNFNTDIILKPYSKVALQNLSLETEKESLVINAENNEYQFSIGDTGIITGELPQQTYSHDNSQLLLSDFQYSLNQKVGGTTPEIGLEWKVNTNRQNKVDIHYKRGLDQEHFNKITLDNGQFEVLNTGTSPNTIFEGSIVDPSGTPFNECYMTINDRYLALGGGRISCKINNILPPHGGNVNNDGIIFGLTNVNPSSIGAGADFETSNITYAIFAKNSSANYEYFHNGVKKTNGAVIPVDFDAEGSPNNDSLVIQKRNGKYVLEIEKGLGTQTLKTLDPVAVGINEELYPFVIFRRGEISISRFRATLSPFQHEQQTEVRDNTLLTQPTPPQQDLSPQTHYFNFGSISLANFLGYNNQINPQEGLFPPTSNFNLVADNEYEPIDVADSFIVEMMGNISLSSYDGLKSVRKSILAVIPESDNNANGSVIFDAKEKVFVDINNVNPITLRNVKTRVVKNDYTPLDIKGEATMTLIFKDENE